MPYYTVPDDVFEDQDLFVEWAGRSREAALRAQAAKEAKGKKKGKRGATAGPEVAPLEALGQCVASAGIRIP